MAVSQVTVGLTAWLKVKVAKWLVLRPSNAVLTTEQWAGKNSS